MHFEYIGLDKVHIDVFGQDINQMALGDRLEDKSKYKQEKNDVIWLQEAKKMIASIGS